MIGLAPDLPGNSVVAGALGEFSRQRLRQLDQIVGALHAGRLIGLAVEVLLDAVDRGALRLHRRLAVLDDRLVVLRGTPLAPQPSATTMAPMATVPIMAFFIDVLSLRLRLGRLPGRFGS